MREDMEILRGLGETKLPLILKRFVFISNITLLLLCLPLPLSLLLRIIVHMTLFPQKSALHWQIGL